MYQVKDIANGSRGLFYKGVFCGIYSEFFGIEQYSGNNGQIFDIEVCINYLLQKYDAVYSNVTVAGNQYYFRVSQNPFPTSEGGLTKHTRTKTNRLFHALKNCVKSGI